ncbi:BhlA/UviB family holin-like peptide [Bacillus marinisedimentorum]|uniref:BhlA/UviB family holin-like peptide n=1 Tax=Bacillus marinisedimentorum TaxID=1821260 RepID=UPI0007E05C7F|nr:BhlA/UviB family holin-like peptide [Bacillus marinisedimentorum]
MDLSTIPMELVVSQGIFAVLFVWLLVDTRKESKERERQLITQIEKQNQAQDRIVQAIERLENQITSLKEVK